MHTLDLVITSADTNLSPSLTNSFITASDPFPILTEQNLTSTPLPSPTPHSFRRISSINITDFSSDLAFSSLITNPPDSLPQLLNLYDITLRSLLDKHAPTITKLSIPHQPNPWFSPAILLLKRARRKLERIYIKTHSTIDLNILRSASNHYNKLIAIAKKQYYSNLVQSNIHNPRNLWKTINHILHRKNTSPLPTTIPTVSLAQTFAQFFSDKVTKLHLTLTTKPSSTPPHFNPPQSPTPFPLFRPATTLEISKLLHESPNKQCELDPIPTILLKQISTTIISTITDIVNRSLSSGIFPNDFKHSLITPILKKPSLDKESLNNYRPISNLSLISKITERIVKSRLHDHLSNNSLYNPNQSAYTKHHSTETTLLSLHDHLINAISHQQVSCLCLLDLSAAFDTIDHSILLHRLSSWFGITDTALNWFTSYLSSRSFSVLATGSTSCLFPLTCGVPQGSVLGPILFNMYTTPLSTIVASSSLNHHLYADDTQLFISFISKNFLPTITHLQDTISDISSWMTSNLLSLNPAKTEFMLIGLPKQIYKILNPTLSLPANTPIPPTDSARNLGIIFDTHLTFSKQISSLTSTCYYHIRDLRRIRHCLDFKTASTIATSLVHSKLDYCNSLYLNLPNSQISRIQKLQNSLARAVTKTHKFDHITPVLKSLHWLKIEQRIHYKTIALTHDIIYNLQPSYLRKLLIIKSSSNRSSDYLTLLRPTTCSLKISNRSFHQAAPVLWNSLPTYLRTFNKSLPTFPSTNLSPPPLALSRSQFLSKLKTYLFSISYPP